MSEVKKIATRASYGAALVELGKKHENLVVLDADLAAATQTGVFKKEFPERHIDCGIAECNMMGIAAGLATTGILFFQTINASFLQTSHPFMVKMMSTISCARALLAVLTVCQITLLVRAVIFLRATI